MTKRRKVVFGGYSWPTTKDFLALSRVTRKTRAANPAMLPFWGVAELGALQTISIRHDHFCLLSRSLYQLYIIRLRDGGLQR